MLPLETTSNSSSSKLNHSIAHSKPVKKKPPSAVKKPPYTMVKSKSDLNTLKTYPDSFTVLPSPKRSPSAGYQSKRSKDKDDDDDSMTDYYEWIKPPAEKLYEAASVTDHYIDDHPFETEHFGKRVSMPSSPIITDKIMVGSSHR